MAKAVAFSLFVALVVCGLTSYFLLLGVLLVQRAAGLAGPGFTTTSIPPYILVPGASAVFVVAFAWTLRTKLKHSKTLSS